MLEQEEDEHVQDDQSGGPSDQSGNVESEEMKESERQERHLNARVARNFTFGENNLEIQEMQRNNVKKEDSKRQPHKRSVFGGDNKSSDS